MPGRTVLMSRRRSPEPAELRALSCLALVVAPAEIGLAAHARTGGHSQRARLDVACHDAARQQIDHRRALDIALQLARNRDLVRADTARELGAGLHRQVALHVPVAL